jgi:hypothetical protein
MGIEEHAWGYFSPRWIISSNRETIVCPSICRLGAEEEEETEREIIPSADVAGEHLTSCCAESHPGVQGEQVSRSSTR